MKGRFAWGHAEDVGDSPWSLAGLWGFPGSHPMGVQRSELFPLFGGEGCTGGYCDDTWVWDGRNWIEKHPATRPGGRLGAAMAYDAKTEQLLMFGGNGPTCGGSYDECPETWSWNGSAWTEVNAHGPRTGGSGAMAYDPKAGTVVFYGGDNANDIQTWAWTGTAWQQVSSSGPCNTAFTSLAPMVGGNDVLFGGYGFCSFQYKTEIWTGTEWIRVKRAVRPTARSFAVMAYDPLTKQDILFSGEEGYRFHFALPDDTWSFGTATG